MAEHLMWLPTVQGRLGIRKISYFFKKWGLVFVLVWLMDQSRDLMVPCVLLGKAPAVPVCCHFLGKGHGARAGLPCPRSGSGCLSLQVSPGRVGEHRVPQCPAETAAGSPGGLQGPATQPCASKVLPSLAFPHPKGAAPAAFPRNRAMLGLPLVLLL